MMANSDRDGHDTESGDDGQDSGGKREYKVPVKGLRGGTDHVTVNAETTDQAFEKAEEKAQRSKPIVPPVTAIEAYDTVNGVTHRR